MKKFFKKLDEILYGISITIIILVIIVLSLLADYTYKKQIVKDVIEETKAPTKTN